MSNDMGRVALNASRFTSDGIPVIEDEGVHGDFWAGIQPKSLREKGTNKKTYDALPLLPHYMATEAGLTEFEKGRWCRSTDSRRREVLIVNHWRTDGLDAVPAAVERALAKTAESGRAATYVSLKDWESVPPVVFVSWPRPTVSNGKMVARRPPEVLERRGWEGVLLVECFHVAHGKVPGETSVIAFCRCTVCGAIMKVMGDLPPKKDEREWVESFDVIGALLDSGRSPVKSCRLTAGIGRLRTTCTGGSSTGRR
jgi:hypothetical protein